MTEEGRLETGCYFRQTFSEADEPLSASNGRASRHL